MPTNRTRLPCALASAAALTMLAACGTRPTDAGSPRGSASGPAPAPASMLRAEGISREVSTQPVGQTVAGMTTFGHDLLGVIAKPGTNTVLSPLSIATAFGMARAGARGETAAQIDRVLHFPSSGLHPGLNRLCQEIITGTGPSPRPTSTTSAGPGAPTPPIVTVANGLFAQNDLAVRREFLATLARNYGAGLRTLDFSSPSAAEAINAWVKTETAGRISRLFDQLDPGTELVLANAVYLKAQWAMPFTDPTQPATFTRADGTAVQAPTMHRTDALRYAAGNGWQAVELPYVGQELAMRVIVPAAGAGAAPADLLRPGTLAAIGRGLRPRVVNLALPRWDFGTDLDLVPALRSLGMSAPFGNADFSGIAPGLFIGQAVHRANITVDENGTEAAAVTGLAFESSGIAGEPITVRADHPFAFEIVHTPTQTPLFLGTVGDPTVH